MLELPDCVLIQVRIFNFHSIRRAFGYWVHVAQNIRLILVKVSRLASQSYTKRKDLHAALRMTLHSKYTTARFLSALPHQTSIYVKSPSLKGYILTTLADNIAKSSIRTFQIFELCLALHSLLRVS